LLQAKPMHAHLRLCGPFYAQYTLHLCQHSCLARWFNPLSHFSGMCTTWQPLQICARRPTCDSMDNQKWCTHGACKHSFQTRDASWPWERALSLPPYNRMQCLERGWLVYSASLRHSNEMADSSNAGPCSCLTNL